MKLRKIAGSILFLIILIAFWQFLYVAATDWLELAKPYAVPHPAGAPWQEACRESFRRLQSAMVLRWDMSE